MTAPSASNMPGSISCLQCGVPLDAQQLEGLCPACLLRQTNVSPASLDGSAVADFVPPAVEALAPLFPSLEILALIGQGGMGAVYKARQKELDRLVALKVLPPGVGDDAGFTERFGREARALAKLDHPGVVTIYDFGRRELPPSAASGTGRPLYFLLMEWVDGVSLQQLLRLGRVSPREALAIVPQICDALQFAHDQGIVHRDIKPENLLVDRRGRVKVVDFGLAKLMGAALPPTGCEAARHTPWSTMAGTVMGTPDYMAPEQREQPDAVDHRADIYALGVVFYQMLTGELPDKRLDPPSKKVAIDVRLDEVVLRALEKEPALRYANATELKTRIERVASEPAGNVSRFTRSDSPAKRLLPGLPLAEYRDNRFVLHWGRIALFYFATAGLTLLAATALAVLLQRRELSPAQSLFWALVCPSGATLALVLGKFRSWLAPLVAALTALLAGIIVWVSFVKPDTRQAAAHSRQGWQEWQNGQLSEAEASFRASVTLNPADANAWNGLGWSTFNAGHAAEAEAAFAKAIALEPNHPGALNGLGQLYLSQRKDEAAESFLLKASPNASAAWFGLARLYLLQGRFEEAEKYAAMVVDSGQGDALAKKLLEAARARRLGDEVRRMIEPRLPGKKSAAVPFLFSPLIEGLASVH